MILITRGNTSSRQKDIEDMGGDMGEQIMRYGDRGIGEGIGIKGYKGYGIWEGRDKVKGKEERKNEIDERWE